MRYDEEVGGDPVVALIMIVLLSPLAIASRYVRWARELRENELTLIGKVATAPAIPLAYLGQKIIGAHSLGKRNFEKLAKFSKKKYLELKPDSGSWLIKNREDDTE